MLLLKPQQTLAAINDNVRTSLIPQVKGRAASATHSSTERPSSVSFGSRSQFALFHGLLEALSKHLQVCIPHPAEGKVGATPLDTREMLTPLLREVWMVWS